VPRSMPQPVSIYACFLPLFPRNTSAGSRGLHARCTITDKPTELPLPLRRGHACGFAALQNATFGPFGFPAYFVGNPARLAGGDLALRHGRFAGRHSAELGRCGGIADIEQDAPLQLQPRIFSRQISSIGKVARSPIRPPVGDPNKTDASQITVSRWFKFSQASRR
jgi:hypothetical protein